MTYEITRIFEDDNIIIYKRMYSLINCCGDKRYYEVSKLTGYTGRQFISITQVNKYLQL